MKKAGMIAGDPEIKRARAEKARSQAFEQITVVKKFRLFHGDEPAGMVVEATGMEVNAWNKNARAFFAWQNSMGRNCLPIMEWREEEDESQNVLWWIQYQENGQKKSKNIWGKTKAEARREFEAVSTVTARIISIDPKL